MRIEQRTALGAMTVVGLILGGTQPAVAAGFQINEHGAIETGRAGAVVSTVDTPSAVFHNPAGLTDTEGTQFVGGLNMIWPGATYRGRGRPVEPRDDFIQEKTERGASPVPYAFVSHALSKTAVVGLGFYNNYGLRIAWEDPDDFVGRTLVQELSLRTFFLTPTVALKLNDYVSVAVGVSLVPATLSLTRVIGATDNGQVVFPATANSPEGNVRIEASAFGVGGTAGIIVRPTEQLRLGFSFRSAISLEFDGEADFTVPDGTPASVAANFPDQSIGGDLTLPHVFSGGIGWVEDNWTIEFSTQVTLWTSYDELRLDFDSGRPVPTTAIPRDWSVSPLYRLGGEYRFKIPLALRLGIAYDVTPVPNETIDPTLPDNDRIIGSFGLGYDFGPVRLDGAFMLLYLPEREITGADGNVTFPPTTPDESVVYEQTFIYVASLSLGVKL